MVPQKGHEESKSDDPCEHKRQYYAWQNIAGEDRSIKNRSDKEEEPFLPSQLLFEQAEPGIPSAVTGAVPSRINGDIRLPPLLPPSQPPQSDLTDDRQGQMVVEGQQSPSMKAPVEAFPSLGRGTPFNAPLVLS